MATNTYTTKQIDGSWCVMQGDLVVSKCGGRTEARDRAKAMNTDAPIAAKVKGSDELADAIAKADVPAEIADMDEHKLVKLANAEHKAQGAAKKAGKPIPAAPHLDEMHRRHAANLLNHQANGKAKSKGGTAGRAVALDDKALTAELTRLVSEEGIASVGAAVKRLREIGKGSNQNRVKAAWGRMLDSGVKLPEKPKAAPAAKKSTPTKAAAKKAAPAKRAAKEVTPRLKGAAAKVQNQQRAAGKAKKDQSPSDIGKAAAAQKSISNRRARKAS